MGGVVVWLGIGQNRHSEPAGLFPTDTYFGWRIVVKGTRKNSLASILPKPTMDMLWGIRTP